MPSLPGRGNPLLVLALAVVAVALVAPHAAAEPPDLDRQIDSTSQRLEVLVERHNALRADLQATRDRSAATSARLAALDSAATTAQVRVDTIAAFAYKTGAANPVMSVLGAGSPTELLTRLASLENAARADLRELRGLAATRGRLQRDRQELDALAATQATQEAELATVKAQVQHDLDALMALRQQIGRTSRGGTRPTEPPATVAPTPPPPVATVNGAAARVVAFAYAQVGKWYRYGAAGPNQYDCSGLALAAWDAAGVGLPHNAARQYGVVRHISRSDLRPGDLVFYYGDIHHVAVFVGGTSVIHAPNFGERVRVDRLDMAPIHGYGRPA